MKKLLSGLSLAAVLALSSSFVIANAHPKADMAPEAATTTEAEAPAAEVKKEEKKVEKKAEKKVKKAKKAKKEEVKAEDAKADAPKSEEAKDAAPAAY